MERRILASVLLIYSLVGWVQMYSRMEMYTKLDVIFREGHDVFWGHVALVGETVNISCRMNNPNQAMWKGQTKVVNSSRVTVVRDHPILRAMIRNVTKEDSGSYRCVGSDINLRVTDISQGNPPTIKGCTCGTYNSSIVCTFFTNVKVADTVDWTITYQPIGEFEQDNAVPCDQFFLGDKDGHVVPSCVLNETLSNSSVDIQFHINGANPFVSSYQILNCSLNSEPVMEDVANWINQDPFVTTPSHFYTSEQKLFFLPPSKHTRHADKDSSRSYIGYIARESDNITWTCEKMKTFLKEPMYSVSDGTDPRIIQVTDDDWMNTTIVHVSFEDTKKYHCGDDTRWLIVINAEKQPKINQHSCVLGEKKESREMQCTFFTNSLLRDHVVWTPTFSISSMSGEDGTKRLDSCGSRPCTDIKCSTVTRKFNSNDLDELTCILNDVEYDKVYDFSLRAENPFINATLTISQPTNYKIVKLPTPSIQLESITSNSAVIRISCPVGDFPKSINYKMTSSLLGVQIFAYKNFSALVTLKDLSSYTNYTQNIYCQFAETNNLDVWSEPLAFSFHTTESIPAVGPEVADISYYIGEPTDECSPPNRVVTLIWKAIPEESGQANGVITDYYIYSHPGQAEPATSKLLRKVSGEKTSQMMCIGGEEVSFAIAGATAAGLSKRYSVLRVLGSGSEIDIKPCHVTAGLRTKPERVELNWNTFSDHRSDQFVVFWCQQNSDDGCLAGTLKWRAVGRATGWVVNGSWNDYKFGVEVHNSHKHGSSGIVWARCLSYPEKELRAADIQVDVDELKAKVNLIETCQKGSRTASSYSVKFCPYDEKTGRCTAEVREHRLLPCDQSREIKLDKFSTDYSFWLVSYAGSLQATSNKKVVRTTNNPLPMSGIVGLSALVLVATVALTALFVWFRRQKKMARTLRRPQLVKPFRLGLESEVYATDDAKEDIDFYSPAALDNSSAIIKIDADEGSMCESVTSEDKLVANEYVTKDNMDDPDLNKCNTHLRDYDKHLPQFSSFKDYQKHWADLNSDTSTAELPDDYLKYTCTASGPNLSTQLFYSDTSSTGGVIDLAKFVQDSGPTQPPPSYKSSTMEYIKLESCNPEQDFSDGDEDFHHNSHECEGFLCETDYTDLSSPDCSGGLTLSFEEH